MDENKQGRRVNVIVDELIGHNLNTVCEKFNLSQSEVVRRGLWLMFDVYLTPEEQLREKGKYIISDVVEDVLKERGVI